MIYTRPGESFTALLTGAPSGLVGTLTAGIENTDGTTEQAQASTGIVEVESGIYVASRTAPDAGDYVFVWVNGATKVGEELNVGASHPAATPGPLFATADEVGVKLGRELSEAEETAANFAIEIVTGLISGVVDEDADWASELNPVPFYYRGLCIEKAVSVLANPDNIASETIGSFSHTFPRAQDLGIFLSDAEQRAIRRVYFRGSTTSTALTTAYSGDDALVSRLDFPWPLPSP